MRRSRATPRRSRHRTPVLRLPSPVCRHPRRDDEPAIEHPDHQTRRCRKSRVLVEQFLEALGLPGVVAEDDRRRAVAHHRAQELDVAGDALRRTDGEDDALLLARRIGSGNAPEPGEQRLQRGGGEEERLARGRRLAATAHDVQVMLGLVPRAGELRGEVRLVGEDEDGVRREEVDDRDALAA